jgi:hypothetical protein
MLLVDRVLSQLVLEKPKPHPSNAAAASPLPDRKSKDAESAKKNPAQERVAVTRRASTGGISKKDSKKK